MRKPSDPNPDGNTRFRDFCIECGQGIHIGTRPSYQIAADGERDYTCENCILNKLTTLLDEMDAAIATLTAHLNRD